MKSRYSIEIDFRIAMEHADKVEKIGNDMNQMCEEELEACIQSIRNHWTGENAELYLEKEEQMRNGVVSLAERVIQTAETIREMAQNLYQAEMQAWEIANERE